MNATSSRLIATGCILLLLSCRDGTSPVDPPSLGTFGSGSRCVEQPDVGGQGGRGGFAVQFDCEAAAAAFAGQPVTTELGAEFGSLTGPQGGRVVLGMYEYQQLNGVTSVRYLGAHLVTTLDSVSIGTFTRRFHTGLAASGIIIYDDYCPPASAIDGESCWRARADQDQGLDHMLYLASADNGADPTFADGDAAHNQPGITSGVAGRNRMPSAGLLIGGSATYDAVAGCLRYAFRTRSGRVDDGDVIEANQALRYQWTWKRDGQVVQATGRVVQSDVSFDACDPGVYSLALVVHDSIVSGPGAGTLAGGIDAATATVTVTEADFPTTPPPPTVVISGPSVVLRGQPATWNATVTDGSAPFTYSWTRNGAGAGGGQSITYTPTTTDGASLVLTTAVTDALGRSHTSPPLTVEIRDPLSGLYVAGQTVVRPRSSCGYTAAASGGLAPYQISWSALHFNQQETSTAPASSVVVPIRFGTFVAVTITDATGASVSHEILVSTDPNAPPCPT